MLGRARSLVRTDPDAWYEDWVDVAELRHITRFDLDPANDAVTYAAKHGGPFDRTILTPRA